MAIILVIYVVIVIIFNMIAHSAFPQMVNSPGYFIGLLLFSAVGSVLVFMVLMVIANLFPGKKEKTDNKSSKDDYGLSLEKSIHEVPTSEVLAMRNHIHADDGFEDRLFRARTEPLILEKNEAGNSSYTVRNLSNGHEYAVSADSCECDDFKKRGLPCKHMLFLAIHNGSIVNYEKPIPPEGIFDNGLDKNTGDDDSADFVPKYWEYYSGQPTGLGYTNLYSYKITGREKGISQKTGKPTNNKKTVVLNAVSSEDVQTAAIEQGISIESVELIDTCPTENQYRFLYGAKIPFPYLINAVDVGALLNRFQEHNDKKCPDYLFDLATQRRAMVSFFSSPEDVISCIIHTSSNNGLEEIYCYAVYCRENNIEFGMAGNMLEEGYFKGFELDAQGKRYLNGLEYSTLVKANKNAKAYKEAKSYLHLQGLLVI